jgi:hypothetical protein
MNEIIQLAKDAATALTSPPRIYSTSGNSTSLWPDQPGSINSTYGTRGLDHRLVHLAGGSKASRRKALIGQPRSHLSLRLH